MNVSEIYLGTKDFAKIFSIIEKTLAEEPNTQIFVDDKIYNELRQNGASYNVFQHQYELSGHYRDDGCNRTELWNSLFNGYSRSIEVWLSLHEGHCFSKEIARACFNSNCKGYKQVVRFNSEQIRDYQHFIAGFKQLLLILAK